MDLKTFLVEKGWVAADASDSVVNEVASAKVKSGELDLLKYTELVAVKAKSAGDAVAAMKSDVKSEIVSEMRGMFGDLAKSLTDAFKAAAPAPAPAADPALVATKAAAPADPAIPGSVRVKKASEAFSNSKTAVCWRKGAFEGRPATIKENGIERGFDTTSEAEMAKCGALAKLYMKRSGAPIRLTEQDIDLIKEALHEDRFVGGDLPSKRKLTDFEIKAVLDETGTSGGAYAVPEYFDSAIITIPLLSGELFPHVDLRTVSRGSSADSYTIGTPTFVSTASGTGVNPFTTTGFVTNFDTNFFPATCAFEWGRDFESDAVPDFGQQVVARIGMEAARWLDEQIAIGDGTTEPQGLFVASNTAVTATNGTGGDFTYNDALNLAFGVAKAARAYQGGRDTGYVMTDTTYKKFMQIVTGVTGDKRPIFGMNIKEYMLGDYPVWVQNNITEGQVWFGNMKAYVLYRRQGLEFTYEDRGSTLLLANKKLVVARMRWGGQLALPATYGAEMAGDIYTP